MSSKNPLSLESQNINLTSLTQDQEISPTDNQATYRSTKMLGLVLALSATAILLPNQHKPTLATNLKRQPETGNNSYAKNPVKKKYKIWQFSDLTTASFSTLTNSLKGQLKYQSTAETFIAPNLITNSIEPGLLFASQPQPLSETESSSSADDSHIIKLRAEIDQLRKRYQNQPRDEPVSSSTIESKTEKTTGHKNQNQKSSTELVSVASVNRAGYNHQFNSSLNEIVTPKLPPLSSPENYLPSAFDGYKWPAKGVLSSGYGWRWGRLHQGIDIAAPIGTPILAAASGKVISAGWDSGGYGNLIKIQHLDGSVTVYGHISKIMVTSGQQIVQGQQIAEMGSTGRSTGSHLHFEIRPQGDFAVNPMTFLNSN
jgi:murein DD-endopeptidase MepM/ murein hydrolase activator NlpD